MAELTSAHIVRDIDEQLAARVEAMELPPRLAILSDNIEHAPSLQYINLKQRVARRLGIRATALFTNNSEDLLSEVSAHNQDSDCHAMIVQLPLAERDRTDPVVGAIAPHKDVDGLTECTLFTPATPLGILTLIKGYDIDYLTGRVAIIGTGRLVGAPLLRLMNEQGAEQVHAFDKDSDPDEMRQAINEADLIISAVGKPELLTPAMFNKLSSRQTFIDAGAAESGGVVVGDISDDLRAEILAVGGGITAKKGSVGPLTIRALLINVLSAAEMQTTS